MVGIATQVHKAKGGRLSAYLPYRWPIIALDTFTRRHSLRRCVPALAAEARRRGPRPEAGARREGRGPRLLLRRQGHGRLL